MDDSDLQELKSLFLEECEENVDVLEGELLKANDQYIEPDALDTIFRAAHSIKGGGATFGFNALSSFTHELETYLDGLRSGAKTLNESALQTMLSAVDVLRDMLAESDPESHDSHPRYREVSVELSLLSGNVSATTTADSKLSANAAPVARETDWKIVFRPNADMAKRGNDPNLVIRELNTLGKLDIEADTSELQTWTALEPSSISLAWNMCLRSSEPEARIREVFEWVEYDCSYVLEQIPDQDSPDVPRSNAEAGLSQPESPDDSGTSAPKKPESTTMRIATDKIDRILDLVGELVITQSMLSRTSHLAETVHSEQLLMSIDQLERNTRELQETVMKVRMLPISFAFGRLPRMIRDLSKQLGKKVNFVVSGESTEVDKTVLDHLLDPLVHLARNAIDHGLESPADREAAGKDPMGTLTLDAYHQSGSIVIKIIDDGKGIDDDRVLFIARERGLVGDQEQLSDTEIQQLIFAPGFSTAETVSDVSGRGVGMDVVRRNIIGLGGKVSISSVIGSGSVVTITLPLTLSILEGQLIQVGSQRFVVPVTNIIETIEYRKTSVSEVPGKGTTARFREGYISLVNLHESLLGSKQSEVSSSSLVLVLEVHGTHIGLIIDAVLGQQQVVIKSLEDNYRKVAGVSGATIMSDGAVALILDGAAFIENNQVRHVA